MNLFIKQKVKPNLDEIVCLFIPPVTRVTHTFIFLAFCPWLLVYLVYVARFLCWLTIPCTNTFCSQDCYQPLEGGICWLVFLEWNYQRSGRKTIIEHLGLVLFRCAGGVGVLCRFSIFRRALLLEDCQSIFFRSLSYKVLREDQWL